METAGKLAMTAERCEQCKRTRYPDQAHDPIVCDARARVRALDRFKTNSGPYRFQVARTGITPSIETMALLREFKRIEHLATIPIVDRVRACRELAEDIAYRLAADVAADYVELDDAIGDTCPRCHKSKSATEPTGDYLCDECSKGDR